MELIKEPMKTKKARRTGEVCPSLFLHHSALCDVGERPYLPSSFQVQEFCTTDRHHRCPLRLSAPASGPGCAENEREAATGILSCPKSQLSQGGTEP